MTTENLPALQSNALMPSAAEFQMLQVIAKNAQDSGLYSGVGQQAKIFMVLLAARELGVSPMLALNGGIWNISGKIEISARLMNGLIRRAGHSIKIIVSNDTHCTLLGTRTDGDSFECSFDMEDAIKAGLAGGNVWKKYPADMLYNRCMSRLARRLFSDVIGNSYVEGEIREAKEVEKKERELEMAECHEITPSGLENDQKATDLPLSNDQVDTNTQQDRISGEDLHEIMKGYVLTSDTFKENIIKEMQKRYNVNRIEDIPPKAFNVVMSAIARNIENSRMQGGA